MSGTDPTESWAAPPGLFQYQTGFTPNEADNMTDVSKSESHTLERPWKSLSPEEVARANEFIVKIRRFLRARGERRYRYRLLKQADGIRLLRIQPAAAFDDDIERTLVHPAPAVYLSLRAHPCPALS
jgi:hypothetical protein